MSKYGFYFLYVRQILNRFGKTTLEGRRTMDNKGRIFLCKCLILIAYIPQLLYAGGAEQNRSPLWVYFR